MDRAAVQRYFANFEALAERQRQLDRAEDEAARITALGASLIRSMEATIPRETLNASANPEAARVAETWARLREGLRR